MRDRSDCTDDGERASKALRWDGADRFLHYGRVGLGHDVTLFASRDSVTSAKLVSCVPTVLRLDPKVM